MNCQEVMDDMQRQLDGDLDDRESEALMTHLRHCPDCAAMFERLQLLSSGLENLPKVTPPYSLVDAILPRLPLIAAESAEPTETSAFGETPAIADEVTERRARKSRKWTDSYAVRALGGAVAAAVVAGLFLVTYTPGGSSDDSGAASQYAADAADAGEATSSMESTAEPLMAKEDAPREEISDSSANKEATGSAQPKAKPPEELSRLDEAGNDAAPAQEGGSAGGAAQDAADGGSEPIVRSQTPNEVIEVPSDTDAGANTSDDADLDTSDAGNQQDAASDDVKASGGETEEPDKKMGITSMAADPPLQSPDGTYSASIEQNVLTIYLSADNRFVLSTDAAPGGIRIVEWAGDSKSLTYEATADDGAKSTYRIDLAKETITLLQNTP